MRGAVPQLSFMSSWICAWSITAKTLALYNEELYLVTLQTRPYLRSFRLTHLSSSSSSSRFKQKYLFTVHAYYICLR